MSDKSDNSPGEIAGDIAGMSFEQALKALEGVVESLEGGQVPLEQSIDLYERGEKLRKHCEDRLKAAELRVERIVSGADGEATGTAPLEAP